MVALVLRGGVPGGVSSRLPSVQHPPPRPEDKPRDARQGGDGPGGKQRDRRQDKGSLESLEHRLDCDRGRAVDAKSAR